MKGNIREDLDYLFAARERLVIVLLVAKAIVNSLISLIPILFKFKQRNLR